MRHVRAVHGQAHGFRARRYRAFHLFRAVAAGAKAVCLTVDSTYMSHRERGAPDTSFPQWGAPNSNPASPELPSAAAGTRQTEPAPYRLQSTFQAQLTWPFVDHISACAKAACAHQGRTHRRGRQAGDRAWRRRPLWYRIMAVPISTARRRRLKCCRRSWRLCRAGFRCCSTEALRSGTRRPQSAGTGRQGGAGRPPAVMVLGRLWTARSDARSRNGCLDMGVSGIPLMATIQRNLVHYRSLGGRQ